MYDTKPPPKSLGVFKSLIVLCLCIIGAYFLLQNRTAVLDQFSVWQYKPTTEIASFVERTGMNDRGKFYFYASHPALLEASDFNKECDRKEQSTAILGCYDGRYIYIYNISNKDIDGIREVTAVHEMLHAAYDRLEETKKQEINKLLEVEYEKLKDNKEFSERMAFYARTEPGERDNELHSVIGTEVAVISPQLEAHYSQYFTDRAKVVTLHQQYASVFSDLQSQADILSTQLTKLGDAIEAASATYNQMINEFNNDVRDFEQRTKNNEYTTQEQFDQARNALLARASQLDANRASINADVARYNTLRDQLASVASQSEALNRSIDSSLAPAPSL